MVEADETGDDEENVDKDFEAGENDNRELEYTSAADKNDMLRAQLKVRTCLFSSNHNCS